jgi:hypothetical protein
MMRSFHYFVPEETELKEKFSPAPVRGLQPGVERIVCKFFTAQS